MNRLIWMIEFVKHMCFTLGVLEFVQHISVGGSVKFRKFSRTRPSKCHELYSDQRYPQHKCDTETIKSVTLR